MIGKTPTQIRRAAKEAYTDVLMEYRGDRRKAQIFAEGYRFFLQNLYREEILEKNEDIQAASLSGTEWEV